MSDSWLLQNVWLIPLLPLAAAVITAALGPSVLRRWSHLPCVISAVTAAVLSVAVLLATHDTVQAAASPVGGVEASSHLGGTAVTTVVYDWIVVGDFQVPVVLRVDPLTALMLVMVTVVGSLIVVYSIGYMRDDPGYWRFFSCVALFLFSMTMLVLASNFLLLFVFWEAVGLCSYLLIGFWYRRPAAASAATKAFLVNRVGDFGFALGILLIWVQFGSRAPAGGQGPLDYDYVFAHVGQISEAALLAICLLLFCGAVGKSAQLPLHVWLPDAMEGPTPVSALIHAATMVTAGVYMVARLSPLFFASPTAQLVVACIGGLTALVAAVIALTQNDLKRILAFSTVSQLGYMFLALGCGTVVASTAAIFHMFTHAFFKALLFLGAGSVMHAMGNVIDITRFGGLRKKLPLTCVTFACGGLALAGFPLLSGFWSKDEILAVVAERSHNGEAGWVFSILFVAGVVTALLTAFYISRAFFMTFWGEEQIPDEAGDHAHESPPVMTGPLIVLALCSLGVGVTLGPTGLIGDFLGHTPGWSGHGPHQGQVWLMCLSGGLALVGIGLGWWMYSRPNTLPERLSSMFPRIYDLSYRKFRFDEMYDRIVVGTVAGSARICRFIDDWIVDGTVQLVSATPRFLGQVVLRRLHNGQLQFYAVGMMAGLVMLILAVSLWG
ncbi:MAG: NADH-quinone oxidoreductase subunit L [Planctomycetaceae bacterium]